MGKFFFRHFGDELSRKRFRRKSLCELDKKMLEILGMRAKKKKKALVVKSWEKLVKNVEKFGDET